MGFLGSKKVVGIVFRSLNTFLEGSWIPRVLLLLFLFFKIGFFRGFVVCSGVIFLVLRTGEGFMMSFDGFYSMFLRV